MAEERKKLINATIEAPPVNVLLVDDREDGLLVLESVLASQGYNLTSARSGHEALKRLAENEFAVILLDVQMPDIDGFQTAALIKEKPAWKDIPILFVTAIHKDTPYIYQGYGVGAVDYIFKPFDPYILQSKVAVFAELYRRNVRIRNSQETLRHKEEELYQSRKLEAIGRLAGGIAHDFNNIVAGILGISEELRESLSADDRRREDLNEIIKSSHRAFGLTRQLLAYARRQVISPEILDLNSIVSNMRELLSRLIGEDIQLILDLQPRIGAIHADRGYLEQIVINLVLNARDAMPQGGVVSIKTAHAQLSEETLQRRSLQLGPGAYVLLSISDNGCGMSSEVLNHIFEPFFTTKDKDSGTGLGLATVYGIVKQSGGDITVQSHPGAGTRMDIYIPRLNYEVKKPSEVPTPALQHGSGTILVVEDERVVRRVVTTLLRKSGYSVLEAGSGPEALELCEHHNGPIELLITDVVMPKMNGRILAERFAVKHPKAAVLYMSGYTEDVIATRGVLEPGVSFVDKSAISAELTTKVRQVLEANRKPTTSAFRR